MGQQLTVEQLIAGCADDSFDGGLSIMTDLEPLGGPGAPVKPAIYEGGKYQQDVRWRGEGEARRKVEVVVIDNVPSQANRIEAALATNRARLGLPELVLDLSELRQLPAHLPRTISSFQFPHRNGDAYLRDAALDGVPFPKTPIGTAVFTGSADNPAALFEWMPQALLFGFWQSHLGKKRQQTKLARSWTSEIIGYNPASLETKVMGLKGDPLNLSTDLAVNYHEDNLLGWTATEVSKAGTSKAKDSLAEIGHGQVPVSGTPAGVSFDAIVQQSTVSFAALRRITTGSDQANAAGRALLVAIGVAGHVAAFGRAFSLRSGCELLPESQSWTWRGANGAVAIESPTFDAAADLLEGCAAKAQEAGLPVGGHWAGPVTLTAQEALAKVIVQAWPNLEEV